MKRILELLLVATWALCFPDSVQAQHTTVSASCVGGVIASSACSGPGVVASATIYFQSFNAARAGASGGQVLGVPYQATVTAGAFSVALPDALAADPNTCYAVTVVDNVTAGVLLGAGLATDGVHVNGGGAYGCVQPTGSTWSFDTYVPPAIPPTIYEPVAGPAGPAGAGYIAGLSSDGAGGIAVSGSVAAGSCSLTGAPAGSVCASGVFIPNSPYKYLYAGYNGTPNFFTAGSNDGTHFSATSCTLTNAPADALANVNGPLASWSNNQAIMTMWSGGVPWYLFTGADGCNFTYLSTITWTSGQLGFTPQQCFAMTQFNDVDNTLHIFAPCSPNTDGTGFVMFETHPLSPGPITAATAWSAPLHVVMPVDEGQDYDFSVYYLNNLYWGIYYDHAAGENVIAESNSCCSGWQSVPGDVDSGQMNLGEGPQLFRIGNHLRAYGDAGGEALVYRDCYDNYPDALPPGKVVAEYDFVPGVSPTTLYDVSGNGLNGTLSSSAPTWIAGGGLSFNGTSNYVDLGNPSALNITQNLWVVVAYYEGAPSYGTLLGKNDGSTNAGSAYQVIAGTSGNRGYSSTNVFSGSTAYSTEGLSIASGSWVIKSAYLDSTAGTLSEIVSTMESGTSPDAATTSPLNTVSAHAAIGSDGSLSSGFFNSKIGYAVILSGPPASDYERLQVYNYVQQKMAARGVTAEAYDLPVGNTTNLATCGWTQATPWSYGGGSTWPFLAKHGSIVANPTRFQTDFTALENPPTSLPATAPGGSSGSACVTGTWTPTDNSADAITFTGVNTAYTECPAAGGGYRVDLYGYFSFPSGSFSAATDIGGLPATPGTNAWDYFQMPITTTASGDGALNAEVRAAGIIYINTAAGNSHVSNSDLAGAQILLSGFYYTY